MNLKHSKELFSRMLYLDREIERNKNSPGRNKYSDQYYNSLLLVRSIQDSGLIPSDDQYAEITKGKNYSSPEAGFYNANIHYYLFEDNPEYCKGTEYKNELNRRIILWLDDADEKKLLKQLWFPLNFPVNYLRFLENWYGEKCTLSDSQDEDVDSYFISRIRQLKAFTDKSGNTDEQRIAEKCDEIASSALTR